MKGHCVSPMDPVEMMAKSRSNRVGGRRYVRHVGAVYRRPEPDPLLVYKQWPVHGMHERPTYDAKMQIYKNITQQRLQLPSVQTLKKCFPNAFPLETPSQDYDLEQIIFLSKLELGSSNEVSEPEQGSQGDAPQIKPESSSDIPIFQLISNSSHASERQMSIFDEITATHAKDKNCLEGSAAAGIKTDDEDLLVLDHDSGQYVPI